MTLDRFRKKGGFLQLVQIVETTEPAKRKNLLHLVASEDPGWAHLLKIKMLTLERVFSWPKEVLSEVLSGVPDGVLVALFISGNDELKAKLLLALPPDRQTGLKQQCIGVATTAHEQFAASVKLIQHARDLNLNGHLDFSFFDPSLVIDEKIAA